MILEEIAQLNNANDESIAANTGKKGLLVELATPEHLIMMPKQFIIPKETDFNAEYIRGKVQDKTFTPIIGASAFEDVSSEDSYNTNSSGVKRLNLKGLIEHKFMFEEGHEFYKQMAKLESFKSFSFAIGDDEGNWVLAKNSEGDYIGLTATHVTPERRLSKVKGGENEMKSLLIQYGNRKQWDTDYDVFLAQYLDFAPEEIAVINGVNTSFNEVPSQADTVLEVSVVLSSDNSTPVEGLQADDLSITKEAPAVDPVIDSISETTPGNYEVTLAEALGNVEPISAILLGVVDSEEILYRTNNVISVTPTP